MNKSVGRNGCSTMSLNRKYFPSLSVSQLLHQFKTDFSCVYKMTLVRNKGDMLLYSRPVGESDSISSNHEIKVLSFCLIESRQETYSSPGPQLSQGGIP